MPDFHLVNAGKFSNMENLPFTVLKITAMEIVNQKNTSGHSVESMKAKKMVRRKRPISTTKLKTIRLEEAA